MSPVTCRQFADFLDDYVEGRLSAEERREFERHLVLCPSCQSYLMSYRATLALEKKAWALDGDQPVPEDVPEDLLKAILAARPLE